MKNKSSKGAEKGGRLRRMERARARAKALIWANGRAQDTTLTPRKPSSILRLAAFKVPALRKGHRCEPSQG